MKNNLTSPQQNWGKCLSAMNNRKQKETLPQMLWWLQELTKGTCEMGYFYWRSLLCYRWARPCNKKISISCFENVHSGSILPWILQVRNLKMSVREKWNVLLEGRKQTSWVTSTFAPSPVVYSGPGLSALSQGIHGITKEVYLANELKNKHSHGNEIKVRFAEKFNNILYRCK